MHYGTMNLDTATKVLTLLRQRGKKGLTRAELNQALSSNRYAYLVLLQLVKEDKACKVDDRWYYGSRLDLAMQFPLPGYQVDDLIMNHIAMFENMQFSDDFDWEKLEADAIDGLNTYLFYLLAKKIPIPNRTETEEPINPSAVAIFRLIGQRYSKAANVTQN